MGAVRVGNEATMTRRRKLLVEAISKLSLVILLLGVAAEHIVGLSRLFPQFVVWTIGTALVVAIFVPFVLAPFTLTWDRFKQGNPESVVAKSPPSIVSAVVLLIVYFGCLFEFGDQIGWNAEQIAAVGLAILGVPICLEEWGTTIIKLRENDGAPYLSRPTN
jgi:hypothetical protein